MTENVIFKNNKNDFEKKLFEFTLDPILRFRLSSAHDDVGFILLCCGQLEGLSIRLIALDGAC